VPVFSCGRSLYIDWRMVVVARGECPASCKKGGGIVWAGEFRGQYVRGEMSYARTEIPGIPVCLR